MNEASAQLQIDKLEKKVAKMDKEIKQLQFTIQRLSILFPED